MKAGRTLLSAAVASVALVVGLVAVAADKQLASADTVPGVMRRILTTTTSSSVCPSEQATCLADATCIQCLTVFADAADECGVSTVTSCDDYQEAICCTVEGEDEDCENDTTFSDYIECLWEEDVAGTVCEGSDFDLSECSGTQGRSPSWGVSIVMCSTTVAALLFTAVGLVV